jgi:hypothetical protein
MLTVILRSITQLNESESNRNNRTSIFCVYDVNGFAAIDVCCQTKEIERRFLIRDEYFFGSTNSEWYW